MVFGWSRSAGKVDLSSVNKRFVSTVLTLKGQVSLLSNDSEKNQFPLAAGKCKKLRFPNTYGVDHRCTT